VPHGVSWFVGSFFPLFVFLLAGSLASYLVKYANK